MLNIVITSLVCDCWILCKFEHLRTPPVGLGLGVRLPGQAGHNVSNEVRLFKNALIQTP
jgi:hypothetical protein